MRVAPDAQQCRALRRCCAALLVLPPAQARPVGAGKDGRPNILVVMTDDQAAADVAHMPNVRACSPSRARRFADAVDSFPLCCPARATFITGQYAHNHGVGGNFYPYGWYGMKDRGNMLPAWLQKVGYRTALIGKWLNGYGARDAHGEVPKGFDIWRGLLDVSAYDYFNFVMNRNGKLKTWGDADFARKLVEFANIEVDAPTRRRSRACSASSRTSSGRRPTPTGAREKPKDYSPDVTGKDHRGARRARAQVEEAVLHLVGAGRAAPRGRGDDADGPARPRPAPGAALRGSAARATSCRTPPSFNEADLSDKPSNMTRARADADRRRRSSSSSSTTRAGSARCSRSTTT